MVRMNIILGFGKQYAKFAWEFGIHRQTRAGELRFLTFEEFRNDLKDKNHVCIEVLCILESHC
jgi:hypothetical protein